MTGMAIVGSEYATTVSGKLSGSTFPQLTASEGVAPESPPESGGRECPSEDHPDYDIRSEHSTRKELARFTYSSRIAGLKVTIFERNYADVTLDGPRANRCSP